MKYAKIVFSFVVWLLLAMYAACQLQVSYGVSPEITVLSLFVLTLLVSRLDIGWGVPGAFCADLTAGIDVLAWAREIIKRWRKDNNFLSYAVNETRYAVGGAAVLIPQPGAKPVVVKNRGSFPATTIRRTDTTAMYVLDEYSTNPTHITLNELLSLSYDKMNDIITDHFLTLLENMADDMLIKWASNLTTANVLYTTGPDTEALESGQTGLRKALISKDLFRAQGFLNKLNVSKTGRVFCAEENMYQQMLDSLSKTEYQDFSRVYDPVNGVLGRLAGFDIITRSSVVTAAADLDDGDLVVNALDAAIGTDDDVVSLCWQRDVVANATGSINLFTKSKDPQFYGDVLSVSARAGGRVRRADGVGIVAIKQAKTAAN